MILFVLWQGKLGNFSWRYKLNTNGYDIQAAVPTASPTVLCIALCILEGCRLGSRGGRVERGNKRSRRSSGETSKRNFPCVLDCLKLFLLGVLQEKLLEERPERRKNLFVSLSRERQCCKPIVALLKWAAHGLISTKAEMVTPHGQRSRIQVSVKW